MKKKIFTVVAILFVAAASVLTYANPAELTDCTSDYTPHKVIKERYDKVLPDPTDPNIAWIHQCAQVSSWNCVYVYFPR